MKTTWLQHHRNDGYPLVIKHGNWKSYIIGGFTGNISINGWFSIGMFDCRRSWNPQNGRTARTGSICYYFSGMLPFYLFFGWGLLYDPYALKNKVLAGFEYALVIGMTIFNNKHIFQAATSSQVGCCRCHNQISQDSLER